jgi:DNA primase
MNVRDYGKAEIRCRCPLCDRGRGKASATINENKGLFYCFRCGEGLNAITLYSKIFGIDNKAAYKELLGSAE